MKSTSAHQSSKEFKLFDELLGYQFTVGSCSSNGHQSNSLLLVVVPTMATRVTYLFVCH